MKLYELDEPLTPRKVLVIFSGGFHPPHSGHLSVYKYLRKKFPIADVFVASTNNTKERPFPFKDKQFLASQVGIPAERFVQVTSPYKAIEITQNYDPATTVLIFGLSEKDKDRLGEPVKRNGTASYMQPFPGSVDKCQPFAKHGYYVITPTIKFEVLGQQISSASQIREMYKNANDTTRMEIAEDLYPMSHQILKIKKLLDKILIPPNVNEALSNDRHEFEGWLLPSGKFLAVNSIEGHWHLLKKYGLSSYDEAYDKKWIRISIAHFYTRDVLNFETTLPFNIVESKLEKLANKMQTDYPEIVATCGSGLTYGIYTWTGKEFRRLVRRKMDEQNDKNLVIEDYIDDSGFWAGENGGASGILPICKSTKRLCLAWRSGYVLEGDCWGTIGGAIQAGLGAPESAKEELAEETGYRGPIALHPAYVFKSGNFTYKNFIGVVNEEFDFNPEEESGWETTKIQWVTFNELIDDIKKNSSNYHFGLLALIKNSYKQIAKLLSSPYVTEHIVKLKNGKYRLLSHKGKNLGTFDSHAAAAKHEGEVEYFKSLKESPNYDYSKFNDRDEELNNIVYIQKDSILRKTSYHKICATLQGKEVGYINLMIDSKRSGIWVEGVEIKTSWSGTGLGQLLYEKAIRYAKIKGFKYFWSDSTINRSPDANKAWIRLSKRFPVTLEKVKINNNMRDQYQIDLDKV